LTSTLRHRFARILAGVVCAVSCTAARLEATAFQVTFSPTVSGKSFEGRVYVFLSAREMDGPPPGPNWFKPDPLFARDVKDWRPGQALVIDDQALGFPMPLRKVPAGSYWALAVMDFNRGEQSFSAAAGNGYSKPLRVQIDPGAPKPIDLRIDQVVPSRKFSESASVKLVDIESKLLSQFHGRSTHLRATVVLPASYERSPRKRYPVIYEIPGFGGNHLMVQHLPARSTDVAGSEMLHVMLDPSCALGHHVFADSANNGPCGRALIEELIPQIEKQFRAIAAPGARFLTGHSSGGWSSLWLQVTYPDFFGGVWSTSPDPVDFRDFQRINIYDPRSNFFTDEAGKARPIARMNGKPVLFYKPFSDMEVVMGHGGQLSSFEAVFSPRGADGRPKQLWNRSSGQIDPQVARSWEKYDIRLVLERNWSSLGPKLAGKLHVYTGSEDTFYLEGAVALLKESLARLGSDAVVEIIPGRNHGTLRDSAMRERIAKEMAAAFRRRQDAH
jgi:hypothetical protein